MSNKIDLAIIIFLGYHLLRGYIAGFSKSLFLSVRFLGAAFATYYIGAHYLTTILSWNMVKAYIAFMGKLTQNFISPFLYKALEMDGKILMITIFLLISILVNLIFELIQSNIKKGSIKTIDKNLGFFLGGIKGLIYIMAMVAIAEPAIQKMAGMEFKEMLSTSDLLKYFYSYNIFLDIFS